MCSTLLATMYFYFHSWCQSFPYWSEFHLPLIVEVLLVAVSNVSALDSWMSVAVVWPSRTPAFDTLWSHPSLHSTLRLSCFNLSIAICVISSHCSSFFMVALILLAHNIAAKSVLSKELVWRVLSHFASSSSLIMVNDLHPDFILCKISVSMFSSQYNQMVQEIYSTC